MRTKNRNVGIVRENPVQPAGNTHLLAHYPSLFRLAAAHQQVFPSLCASVSPEGTCGERKSVLLLRGARCFCTRHSRGDSQNSDNPWRTVLSAGFETRIDLGGRTKPRELEVKNPMQRPLGKLARPVAGTWHQNCSSAQITFPDSVHLVEQAARSVTAQGTPGCLL